MIDPTPFTWIIFTLGGIPPTFPRSTPPDEIFIATVHTKDFPTTQKALGSPPHLTAILLCLRYIHPCPTPAHTCTTFPHYTHFRTTLTTPHPTPKPHTGAPHPAHLLPFLTFFAPHHTTRLPGSHYTWRTGRTPYDTLLFYLFCTVHFILLCYLLVFFFFGLHTFYTLPADAFQVF